MQVNMSTKTEGAITKLDVATYRIPTDKAESDGTLTWDHTDVVVVHLIAAGATGLGWSYASQAAGEFVAGTLRDAVVGRSALGIEGIWHEMHHRLRNAGRVGAGMMAISAMDLALWDLKAKLLEIAVVDLLGTVREAVDIYGSGGFTSYTEKELMDQLSGWAQAGIGRVKMKVGRDAAADIGRVRAAREAIGPNVKLFVDANGGYTRKQALAMAQRFAEEFGVSWFEEPRPSDDLAGLRLLRDRGPAGMDIAAGEYGDTTLYFRRMLEAQAVDCLQADATRCGGYTGFLKVGALCEAFEMPLSAHCAPQLHAHIGCAVQPLRHVEYFHDHNRIDRMLFDGVLEQKDGALRPDRKRAGHGLTFKSADAERYRV
jgi:L-alanine-DL-glutamate epimerase-like enolase superfamily enzyme